METSGRSNEVAVETDERAGAAVGGGAERRRDERYAVHGDAEILVTGGMSMFRGRIVNISATGCYVQTVAWVRLPPRTSVELVFVVKGHAVRARAEACYSESKIGLGLRFLVMEEAMQRRLDNVLAGLQRELMEKKVDGGKTELSALDVLTATATATADAALKSAEGREAVGRNGSVERLGERLGEGPGQSTGEEREEGDARFADLEELGLAVEGELAPEDAAAIAAMAAMEEVAASGSGVEEARSGGGKARREPEGVLERPAAQASV